MHVPESPCNTIRISKRRLILCAILTWLGICAIAQTATGTRAGEKMPFGRIILDVVPPVPKPLMTRLEGHARDLEGSGASEHALGQLAQSILNELAQAGYRSARVEPSDFTAEANGLGLRLTITPGPIHAVVSTSFDGLTHTDTAWLRRTIALTTPSILTDQWLRTAQRRLDRIASVRVSAAPVMTEAQYDHPDTVYQQVRWPISESRSAQADGLLAAGGGPTDGGLTGRASLRFDGLFGRDRSAQLQYQRPRPGWHALTLDYRETGSLDGSLDWRARIEDAAQRHNRQSASLATAWRLSSSGLWRVLAESRWQRITPGKDSILPARILEATLGLGVGAPRTDALLPFDDGRPSGIESRAIFSRRAEWDPQSPDGGAEVRLRLETDAGTHLHLAHGWIAAISAASRWWATGEKTVGPGDEWNLGGADHLRGWEEQSMTAASGIWTLLECARPINRTMRIGIFGETAHLRLMTSSGVSPRLAKPLYGYGLALGLHGGGRVARLEAAWSEDARMADGILRLRITQAW